MNGETMVSDADCGVELVSRKKRSGKSLSRIIRIRTKKKIRQSAEVFKYLAKINDLKSEIKLLTEYSTDVIYRLRYDTMQYDYISPSINKLIGMTPEQIKKASFRSLILDTKIVSDGMRSVQSFGSLEEVRKSGNVRKWQADYLMQRSDGQQIWVSDVSYPWFDSKGNVVGSVGVLRDITDRVNAEKFAQGELIRLANTDQLTGIANRRCFFDRLDEEMRRQKRTHGDFSVMLIDIDYFKKINDSFGHDAGDKVIQEVSRQIGLCLRETDLLARVGGEEFAAILTDTPLEGAYYVAERIRNSIAKNRIHYNGVDITTTVSIGVAESSSEDGIDASRLYKMADTRLYIAKNTGRNQVSMDELVAFH